MRLANGTINHTPSTTMVFQSSDYGQFKMIKGNRVLDQVKIRRILSDIERGLNLLPYFPILVKEQGGKLEIIDGQHRFVVAKKLKQVINYIVGETLSLYDIARLNSNTEKWKPKDFINCYVELGNEEYMKLDKCLSDYPGLSVSLAVAILGKGRPSAGGGGLMEAFQRGEFKAEEERAGKALLKHAKQFEFGDRYSKHFLHAIGKVIDAEAYPIQTLIEKVNADPEQLQIQDHYKRYLTNLEEIASKGKHKRVAIY